MAEILTELSVKWLRTEWCEECLHESLEIFGLYLNGKEMDSVFVWCDYHSKGGEEE